MAKAKEASTTLKGSKPSKASKATNKAQTKASKLSRAKVSDSDSSQAESDTSEAGSESDSDEESEGTSSAAGTPTPASSADKKVNGLKRKDSTEESEDVEMADAPQTKKARKDRSSEEESESEEESTKVTKSTSAVNATSSRSVEQGIVTSIPVAPFQPPTGYRPVEKASNSLLSLSDVQGKQIWYITAPSTVPMSAINQVALDAIRSKKPVLNHNGHDYVLNEDNATNNEHTAVLIPGKAGYEQTQQRIEKTLHLRQNLTIPAAVHPEAAHSAGSATAADMAAPSVKSIRPQPKGLRMRFKPTGFGSGRPGTIGSGSEDEDDDMEEATGAVFQFPKTLGAHGVSEKKDTEKKSKKKRKEKQGDVDGDTISKPTAANDEPAELSKEEKAKRKEEKRKKKEAKR